MKTLMFILFTFIFSYSSTNFILTIDDAPSSTTVEMYKLVQKYNITPMWFVIGKNIRNNPIYTKMMIDSNFIIGNHSYYHSISNFRDFGPQVARNEITSVNDQIKLDLKYFRAPYGLIYNDCLVAIIDLKMIPVPWHIAFPAWYFVQPNGSYLRNVMKSQHRETYIILIHDTERDYRVLEFTIKECLKHGTFIDPTDYIK